MNFLYTPDAGRKYMMTENDYLYKIRNCKFEIEKCEEKIASNNTKIDEIYQIVKRLNVISDKLYSSSESGKTGMNNLVDSLCVLGLKVKKSFFSEIFNAYSGSEYRQTKDGIDNSINISKNALSQLENENKGLERKIISLNEEISTYRYELSILNNSMGC